MPDFGIICETNPIHNGHKFLIDTAKSRGADRVVCIMSGNTVQRGEFSVADKYLKAEALIRCGADLVMELPFPWSCASAEYFSTAGVYIASELCDKLIFGSECGDISFLKKAAYEAGKESFREEYNSRLTKGEQAASSYYEMIKEKTGKQLLSNDLLGIEYIRAANNLRLGLDFETIKRCGDGYRDETIKDSDFASAMAIRKLWREGSFEETEKYIPQEAFKIYLKAAEQEELPNSDSLDNILLSYFRLHSGDDFCNVAGAGGGVANRICSLSRKACSAEELLSLVKNKRYTDSFLRRVMLYCLADVQKSDLERLPEEALLLGANAKGRELLASKRKNESIKIITKPADMDRSLRQNILSDKIESVFSLLYPQSRGADEYLKKKPYFS